MRTIKSLNHSLILVNKPSSVSSANIGNKLKKILKIKKTGHVGTLDLEATGLLMILTGMATRFQSFLLDFDKEYNGIIQLGIRTSTDDIFGDIITKNDISILESKEFRLELEKSIINKFSGTYTQISPNISAKKVNGVPSYKLARLGKETPLKEKKVNAKIKHISINKAGEVSYDISVSSGFYVRSLARDIGELSGFGGAAKSINRESVGPFKLLQSVHLEELINSEITIENLNWAIPLEKIFSYLPYDSVILSDPEDIKMFLNGNKNLIIKKPIDSTNKVIVKDYSNKPIGIINFENNSNKFNYELLNPTYRASL